MRRFLACALAWSVAVASQAGGYIGSWKIDDVATFTVVTHTASTGALTDADSVPAYRVYEDETGTAILTGSMAKLDDANTTGFYSEQLTLSAANGLEKGKSYSIYVSAAVAGVTGGTTFEFQIEAEVDSNTNSGAVPSVSGSVGSIATGGIAAASFAAGAIDAAAIAADAVGASELATDAIGSAELAAGAVTEIVGTPAGASVSADIAAVKAETASIQADTNLYDTDAEYATAIWNAATASYGTASTYGLLVETDLDAAISSRMATYTQPTGFLTATFPSGTIANTTNITAGTMTTASTCTAVTAISTGGIAAASFAAGAIDAAAIAANAIGSSEIAPAAINSSEFGQTAADLVWASTTRTLSALDEDSTTIDLDGSTVGTASTCTTTAAVGSGAITAASFGAGAIDAAAIATDAIGAAEVAASALSKGTEIAGFNDLSAAQVESEVNDALIAQRLDELLNADSDIDGAAPPTVGSVFHEALTKTAGSFTYDQSTDSQEAIRDRGDAAWTTATGFSTHSAADVWTSGTRTLTAATNITSTGGTTVPQTGDTYARLGAPAGASTAADIAAVKVDTAAVLIDTAALDTADEVQALVWDSTTVRALTELDEDNTTIDINGTTVGTATTAGTCAAFAANSITASAVADGAIDAATFAADTGLVPVTSGTAQSATATTILLATAASANDQLYRYGFVRTTGGTGAGQTRLITSYVSKTATVYPAWDTNPSSDTTYVVISWFGQ